MQFLPLLNQYPAEWKRIQGLFQYRSELLVLFFFFGKSESKQDTRVHSGSLGLFAAGNKSRPIDSRESSHSAALLHNYK